MSTVRDLIKGSMRLLGLVASGETPSADELNDALSVLNDMLESWSTQSLLVPTVTRESFALISGQGSYTMGTTGDFATTRPVQIVRLAVELPGSDPFEVPLHMLNLDQWADVRVKTLTSTIPTKAFVEGTSPLETIHVWPKPTQTENLIVYSAKALGGFTSVNQTLSLQPGYAKAIRYALAVELAPEFGKTAAPDVVGIALNAKADIKRINAKPIYLSFDSAIASKPSTFNWITGE